jgi:hypothetical protein
LTARCCRRWAEDHGQVGDGAVRAAAYGSAPRSHPTASGADSDTPSATQAIPAA